MWSNDATQNLLLAQTTGLQSLTQIRPRADGGFYISWLDGGHGYSLYLQRLDVNGNLMLGPAGKLVCERQLGSCSDYRLSVDLDGNAIIGIDSGIARLFTPGGTALAFKVSPSGEMVWGESGIAVSPPEQVVGEVRCAATSDGGAAIFWGSMEETTLHVARLDASGSRLWTCNPGAAAPMGDVRPVEIVASDAGSVICAFVLQSDVSSLLTQKLASADGSKLWGDDPLVVVDARLSGVSLPMQQDPTLLSDQAGGAIFGYPLMDASGSEKICVQRIDTHGVASYETNGLRVTDSLRKERAPRFGFSAADSLIYALWVSGLNASGADPDVRAQCIDETGARLWGGSGVILTAPVPNPVTSPAPVEILSVTGGALAAWVPLPPSGYLPQPLRVSLLDSHGAPVWQEQSVEIKSLATTTTDDACGAISASGYGAFAWTSSDNTTRAQNVNEDGTLGRRA